MYHQQDMCVCQQRLSLLIIKYRYYETYLVLVIDICYIVNLIYSYMPYFSGAILGFYLGQITFFWDK